MNKHCCIRVVLAATVSFILASVHHAAEPDAAAWKLVWSDEFDGKDIDRTKWDFDLGNGFFNYDANTWISGWGNDELQYYTREPDNAFVKDGMLHIRAVKESCNGCGYTSARLKTRKTDGSPLFSQEVRQSSSSAPSCRPARASGRRSGCCRRTRSTAAGRRPARSTSWRPAARSRPRCSARSTSARAGRRTPHASKEYMSAGQGHHRRLPRLRAGMGAGRDPLVRGRPALCDAIVLVEQQQDGGNKGAKPTQEADLNPWPAPFDQPFYLVMNVAVGGKFPRQSGQDDAVPGGDGGRLRPRLRQESAATASRNRAATANCRSTSREVAYGNRRRWQATV